MRKSEESKLKPKKWMVEEGANKRLDGILIERRDLISREDLLKFIRSKFEALSLRNLESLQEIILPINEEILEIAEDTSYLGNDVKM